MAYCPHCGEPVPDGAISCRECGSDADTGWNVDIDYELLDIPDYLIANDDESVEGPPLTRRRWSESQRIAGLLFGAVVTGLLIRVLLTDDLVLCAVIAIGALAFVSEALYRYGILETRFASRPGSRR